MILNIQVNPQDKFGWTPLIIATFYNKPLIVKLLLRHGANPDIADKVRISACLLCHWHHLLADLE
jgi:ankyrin repeat protein